METLWKRQLFINSMLVILIHKIKKNYEFGKKKKIEPKQKGRKNNRDQSPIKIPKSAAIMAAGISARFLTSNPNELCDKVNLLLRKKKLKMFLIKTMRNLLL